MAMLIGVKKWVESLGPGWTEEFHQGILIHSGDSGIAGRGEGRGGLSGGASGFSWVLVGALGGLFSRRIGKVGWSQLTDLVVDEDSASVSFGYWDGPTRRGRVTFKGNLDIPGVYGPRSPLGSPRWRFITLGRRYLPAEGWGYEVGWQFHRIASPGG